MIYAFVAPTRTGVLLGPDGYLPTTCRPDTASIEVLMSDIAEKYGADLQLLIPVGTLVGAGLTRVIAVGEIYEQGKLHSGPPPIHVIGLLAALVRGGLSNWRVEAKEADDFSIKFLGS